MKPLEQYVCMNNISDLFLMCLLITATNCYQNVDNGVLSMDTRNMDLIEDINEVRCYCNLPICISTSYMCKTKKRTGSGCFTDVVVSIPVQRATHGCLDLLPRVKQTQCRNEPTTVKVDEPLVEEDDPTTSLLLCCDTDMCNHVDMPENHVKYNESIAATTLGAVVRSTNTVNQQQVGSIYYDNNEVWFRAATIAVPICGALILLMLILLAIKILQSDSDEAIISAKLRSKRGGGGAGIFPLYAPIQLKTTPNLIYKQQSHHVFEHQSDYSTNNSGKLNAPLLFSQDHVTTRREEQPNGPSFKLALTKNRLTSDESNDTNCSLKKYLNLHRDTNVNSTSNHVSVINEQNSNTFVKKSIFPSSNNNVLKVCNREKYFSNDFYTAHESELMTPPSSDSDRDGQTPQHALSERVNNIVPTTYNIEDNNIDSDKLYMYEKTLLS